MNDWKSILIMIVGGVMSLLSPIEKFMGAMTVLFILNFMFGLLSAIVNKEGWSTKKAMWFFGYCAIFFVTCASLFVIGHFMGQPDEAQAVVKCICFLAVYIFSVNIVRNWKSVLVKGTAWYKFVDLLYYVLTMEVIEKLPMVKRWQEGGPRAVIEKGLEGVEKVENGRDGVATNETRNEKRI